MEGGNIVTNKNDLINSYNDLPLDEKRKEIGREIAEITLITQELLTDLNPNYPTKSVDEFNNLFDKNTSESTYLTELYADIVDLKETLGDYCDFATSMYYDDVDDSYDVEDYAGDMGFAKVLILGLITFIIVIGIIFIGVSLM